MMVNRKPPVLSCRPDGTLSFLMAEHSWRERLNLAQHDHTHLDKVGFAIDAINRWNAFVQSVEQIEGLICKYEKATGLPLGGPRDE